MNKFRALTLALLLAISVPAQASYTGPTVPANHGGTGLTSPGTSGNCLVSNGAVWASAVCAGASSPGGANGTIQYNNSGAFGGYTVGQTLSTASTTLNGTQPADRIVSGTTDTILVGDLGRIVKYTSGSSIAVTVPNAATSGFTQGFGFTVNATGAGTATLTPTTSTINGASSFAVPPNTGCYVRSDGTNYQIDFADCTSLPIAAANLPNNVKYRVVGFTTDGGGSAITTGVKGYYRVPFSGTITSYVLTGDQSGSVVVDIWKVAGGGVGALTIPTITNTITASALPTLSSAQSVYSTTLTGWTTSVSAGDVFGFNVNSATTISRLTLQINITTN